MNDPDQIKELIKAVNAAADAMINTYTPILDAIRRDVAHLAAASATHPALAGLTYVGPYQPGQVAEVRAFDVAAASAIETVKLATKRDRDGDLWVSWDGEYWTMVQREDDGERLAKAFGPYTVVRIEPLTT